MQLFIMRHGEAEGYAVNDSERSLTARGQAEVEAILSGSLESMAAVDCIYASPYLRAQQTAKIASRLLRLPIITCEHLVPDTPRSTLVKFVESLQRDPVSEGEQPTPLLVTHQPLVGGFVDWLCGLEYGQYIMGTSALASIDTSIVAGSCGSLNFMRQL